MDGATLALAFGLTSVPAFLVARSLARSHARERAVAGRGDGVSGLLSRMMFVVAGAMLAGAVGMLWAGSDAGRIMAVALLMALVVNGMAIAMLVAVLRRRRRDGRR
jgi:hypothetical protein